MHDRTISVFWGPGCAFCVSGEVVQAASAVLPARLPAGDEPSRRGPAIRVVTTLLDGLVG